MIGPRTIKLDELADVASCFETLAHAADEDTRKSRFARDRHFNDGRAQTWARAAKLIRDIIGPAPIANGRLQVVGGSEHRAAE